MIRQKKKMQMLQILLQQIKQKREKRTLIIPHQKTSPWKHRKMYQNRGQQPVETTVLTWEITLNGPSMKKQAL